MTGKTYKKPKTDAAKPERPTRWFVHTRDDNTEVWFSSEPHHFKSLRVELIHESPYWWERCRTWSLQWQSNGAWEPTQPPGIGWKLHCDRGEFCIWRRRRQPWRPLLSAGAGMAEVYPRPPRRPELPLGA